MGKQLAFDLVSETTAETIALSPEAVTALADGLAAACSKKATNEKKWGQSFKVAYHKERRQVFVTFAGESERDGLTVFLNAAGALELGGLLAQAGKLASGADVSS